MPFRWGGLYGQMHDEEEQPRPLPVRSPVHFRCQQPGCQYFVEGELETLVLLVRIHFLEKHPGHQPPPPPGQAPAAPAITPQLTTDDKVRLEPQPRQLAARPSQDTIELKKNPVTGEWE